VTILSFLGAVHWGLAMSSSLVGPVGARIANAGEQALYNSSYLARVLTRGDMCSPRCTQLLSCRTLAGRAGVKSCHTTVYM
jgi:hypothetical protein